MIMYCICLGLFEIPALVAGAIVATYAFLRKRVRLQVEDTNKGKHDESYDTN